MVFSETTNRAGLIQLLEDLTSTQSASTSSYTLAVKTRDINNAFADYQNISTNASGTWQADDTNHTKYAEIFTNIILGQQDYSFTNDEQGNQILDIYRVEAKDSSGNWILLGPYNENAEITALEAQATTTGTPFRYYKTANGIFLDKTPSYNSTNGLKIYIARTPSYFLSTDTTKEPGIPQMFHRYLAYKPAYWYWMPKDSAKANVYKDEIDKMEVDIVQYYNNRKRDEKRSFTPKFYNYN